MKQPPKLTSDDVKKINSIFYSHDFLMRNASALYKEAIKRGIKHLSFQDIKRGYYDNQEIVQIFHPLPKKTEHENKKHHISAFFPGDRLYMDTMFFKPYKVFIIICLDLASRYVWLKAYSVKTRLDETKQYATAPQATKLLDNVVNELARRSYSIANLWTDSGYEFLSVFHKYCIENHIAHTFTMPGDHVDTAPIDAFCRSFRLSVEKWVAVHSSNRLLEVIPKLVETYNSHVHQTIKVSPKDYLANESLQVERSNEHRLEQKNDDLPSSLDVGDSVRVEVRRNKNPFNKIRPNWSKHIYKIKSVEGNKYLLTNGRHYRRNKLLHIEFPELVMRWVPSESLRLQPSESTRTKQDKAKKPVNKPTPSPRVPSRRLAQKPRARWNSKTHVQRREP